MAPYVKNDDALVMDRPEDPKRNGRGTQAMTRTMVLGAGKIGASVVELLSGSGDYAVTVADQDAAALDFLNHGEISRRVVDVTDAKALREALDGMDSVISACPFYLNVGIAEAAAEVGANYFDVTEDVKTTRAIRRIAADADSAFAPQCGLAPGFISIVAMDMAGRFDELRELHMRVGALPQYPTNAFKYNLTWSTDGLINEYCEPCDAIYEGAAREMLPLEGLESFSFDGIAYEAFNTSGGLGTLCETLAGRVRDLNYKTVRYPGHRDMMHLLVKDLRLGERRELFRDVLEHAVPVTEQDVVLILVTASGMRGGRLTQATYPKKIYAREMNGRVWSAIQITTAAGICAMVDLHREGKLPATGFIRQEDADFNDFIANRFGRCYA